MNPELKKALAAERKNQREVLELQHLKAKLNQLKNPDKNLLALIDAELKARNA